MKHKSLPLYVSRLEGGYEDAGRVDLAGYTLISDERLWDLEAAESARRDDYQNWMAALDRNAELLAKLEAAEKNLSCCQAEREEAAALFLSVKTRLTEERDALRAELSKQQALTAATQHIAEVAQSRANQLQAKITEMEKQFPYLPY